MTRFIGWDIWIEFTVNVERPVIRKKLWSRFVSWIRAKKRWWWAGWRKLTSSWWYYEEYEYSETEYVMSSKLDNASRTIARLIKTYLEKYSPVDKKHPDDVVMRNNVVRAWISWEYEVWYENIPYATRRNEEQSAHYNVEWNNLHFVEKAWNDHIDEYEEILDKAAEDWADELLSAYLNKSSWATTGYNWWEQTQGLYY